MDEKNEEITVGEEIKLNPEALLDRERLAMLPEEDRKILAMIMLATITKGPAILTRETLIKGVSGLTMAPCEFIERQLSQMEKRGEYHDINS